MKVIVIDKETGKKVWEEHHNSEEELNKAIQQLKENNFNPDYFDFIKF